MNRDQLLQNIRNDFMHEIKIFVISTPFQAVNSVQIYSSIFQTIIQLLKKKTIVNGLNLIERNGYEYLLYNIFNDKLDFSHRLTFRMISAGAASMTTSALMLERKNISNFVIIPTFQASYYGILFMIQNPKESKKFLNDNFPKTVKYIEQNPITGSICRIINKVHTFFNQSPQNRRNQADTIDFINDINQDVNQLRAGIKNALK